MKTDRYGSVITKNKVIYQHVKKSVKVNYMFYIKTYVLNIVPVCLSLIIYVSKRNIIIK